MRASRVEPQVVVITRRPLLRRAVERSCLRAGLGLVVDTSRRRVSNRSIAVVDLADPEDRHASTTGLDDVVGGPASQLLICDRGSRAALLSMLVDIRPFGDTVHAVILVDDEPAVLDRALQHVAAGEAFASSGAARLLFELFRSELRPVGAARAVRLTPREADVARCMAQGLSSKATAVALGVSPKTIEVHRSAVFRKLGARSASEAIAAVMADPTLLGGPSKATQ